MGNTVLLHVSTMCMSEVNISHIFIIMLKDHDHKNSQNKKILSVRTRL